MCVLADVCVDVCVCVCVVRGYMIVRKGWGEHRRAEASTQCGYMELCVLGQVAEW